MSAEVKPSLEDLRQVQRPAWLWDAERKRIVWANERGMKAFACNTLFELVNRPFDARDPGVERLAALSADLSWGQHRKALLHLPSTGTSVPFACDIYVHALADGRQGLLAVEQADVPKVEGAAPAPAPAIVNAPEIANAPTLASKTEAFAALAKSLTDNLNGRPAPPQAIAAEAAAAPANLPFPVRHTLDGASFGVIVCRDGKALFATPRAASLLGHATVAAVLADTTMLADLHAVPAGLSLVVEAQRPDAAPLLVSRHALPWQNGPAEQFSLRQLARMAAAPPPEVAKPVAAPPQPAATSNQASPPAEPIAAPAPAPAQASAPQPEHVPQPAPPTVARQQPAAPATVATSADAVDLDELKAILDVASDGIVTLGKNGDILSLSAAAEAMFGVSAGEAIGRPLADMLHPESRRAFQDYLSGLKNRGLAAVFNDGREMLATNAQGGLVPLFMTIGTVQSPHSRASFCVVMRDLTSWKRTENDLIQSRDMALESSRQKSEFLARISHELRTPLNAILGFSEVMRTQRFGPMGNDKYLAYANDIHASGNHLLSVVGDLLDLSRIEAGKLDLDFMAVSIEEVVDYAFNLLREEAGASGIILRKSLPADLPNVVADLKTLRQVLINLVSNAIKYSNAGSEVLVSAALAESGALTLRIKDTGIGMSAGELEEVLKPYGRVDNPARQRPGTGLGLPLTKSLVEANRARFAISSESGRGTLVEVSFPGPRVLAS